MLRYVLIALAWLVGLFIFGLLMRLLLREGGDGPVDVHPDDLPSSPA